ncbi:MAG TPA: hypothetical protein VHY91_16750 [Pirellulales bacterium]|jgi:hypothetical protein|nr:hypothetical protein [Pirellulales bacterium]
MQTVLSTRDVAELLGSDVWRVRRLFEDGTLSEPDRLGGKRAIPREWLPRIVDAMRARHWLPVEAEAVQ